MSAPPTPAPDRAAAAGALARLLLLAAYRLAVLGALTALLLR